MTSEQSPAKPPSPEEVFGFTEQEQLYDRVNHERLLTLLDNETSAVHRVELSSNSYGEFLFITLSKPNGERRMCVSFYGLGYHDYRERWFTDEWHWYLANAFPETLSQEVPKEEAKEQIQERLDEIKPYAAQSSQSSRGRLFETLAELTDDDGAITELEDLDDLADWLADDM